jgi:flavorubredoxin
VHALVVYESLWGNTAAVARAIAEGLGDGARAVTPDQVSQAMLESADLLVAGAPVFAFGLPTEKIRDTIERDEADAPVPPDLSHPSLRTWLDTIPRGTARTAAFETRIWWSPRGATGDIEQRFARAGYQSIGKAQKFVVRGKYGPLREGELERAREWGTSLRGAIAA